MNTKKREYSRGALAKAASVNIETVRFYEQKGLMPNPPRTTAGYRRYSQAHLERLIFIKRAKELGFQLEETGKLLSMIDGEIDCSTVQDIALANIELINAKIADLTQIRDSLKETASKCTGEHTPECALIERLLTPVV
ncbi:MerR family transcriptional regulator [Kordiimonas laminariae]|uniref:MerR family transcriptional regulator n=1 Tax=Kordiimonas laminariae TaxID=2917717 RepID=UPI001FF5F9DC|nr:helix-turn-helix domain-containing protein [Kordiimonas laminariae]MCK0070728.1 helix-turn-helix domain-containing protein [Kordiimonas laminariae]